MPWPMPKMDMAAPTKPISIVEMWRKGNQAMLLLGHPVGSSRGEGPSARLVKIPAPRNAYQCSLVRLYMRKLHCKPRGGAPRGGRRGIRTLGSPARAADPAPPRAASLLHCKCPRPMWTAAAIIQAQAGRVCAAFSSSGAFHWPLHQPHGQSRVVPSGCSMAAHATYGNRFVKMHTARYVLFLLCRFLLPCEMSVPT